MLLSIDPNEPEDWLVGRVAHLLRRGGVVVLPTDTVYAFACVAGNPAAVERLYRIKGITPAKPLSLLVRDIATAARFARDIPNPIFRAMRRVLPGPYTLIFQATSEVPRVMLRKRRTVGIRLPDCPILQAVLESLEEPLISTSVRNASDEWIIDPVTIDDLVGAEVEVVVDGGLLLNEPSTIVDLSGSAPVVVREGKGDPAALGMG
jgi:tRNA threonylcarbamoyl adenosine modification protein (Sua5/YciO/YrdC/YwlC family)